MHTYQHKLACACRNIILGYASQKQHNHDSNLNMYSFFWYTKAGAQYYEHCDVMLLSKPSPKTVKESTTLSARVDVGNHADVMYGSRESSMTCVCIHDRYSRKIKYNCEATWTIIIHVCVPTDKILLDDIYLDTSWYELHNTGKTYAKEDLLIHIYVLS